MKFNFIISLLVTTLLVLSVMPSVLGAITVTVNTPATSATLSGNYVVNATIVGNATDIGYACNSTLTSASTGNSTAALGYAGGGLNTTEVLDSIVATVTTVNFEDSNDYTLVVNCSVATDGTDSGTATVTGLTIDNTLPTTPSSLSPISMNVVDTTDTQTFSATVTNRETTSCTYSLSKEGMTSGDGYITGAGTYAASTCSFTKAFANTDTADWYWEITASDGTNTTTSGKIPVQVRLSSPGSLAFTSASTSGTSATSKLSGLFQNKIVLIAVGALVLWLLFKKK